MAKEKLSLEDQIRQADVEELHYRLERDSKFMWVNDSSLAFDAVQKIHKRNQREWVKAQRRHVKAVRTLERLRQKLNAAGASTREPAQPRHGS